MQIPAWIILVFSLTVPAATMAAEGNPEAGKAKAEAAGCFACHGVDGVATADGLAADKNVPNLAGEPDLYLQFQLVFFRKGVRKNEVMNAMAESLSDDDLRDISAYYASLPAPDGPKPPDAAPKDTALGAKIAAGIHCTNCHGDHFEGVDNIGPPRRPARGLSLQGPARLQIRRPNVATGAAGYGGGGLSAGDLEMKALAHYVSRLH